MSASITPAYAARRDPSEPWRWRCPDCGSTVVTRAATNTDVPRFECDDCGWWGPEPALVDARGEPDA